MQNHIIHKYELLKKQNYDKGDDLTIIHIVALALAQSALLLPLLPSSTPCAGGGTGGVLSGWFTLYCRLGRFRLSKN